MYASYPLREPSVAACTGALGKANHQSAKAGDWCSQSTQPEPRLDRAQRRAGLANGLKLA